MQLVRRYKDVVSSLLDMLSQSIRELLEGGTFGTAIASDTTLSDIVLNHDDWQHSAADFERYLRLIIFPEFSLSIFSVFDELESQSVHWLHISFELSTYQLQTSFCRNAGNPSDTLIATVVELLKSPEHLGEKVMLVKDLSVLVVSTVRLSMIIIHSPF